MIRDTYPDTVIRLNEVGTAAEIRADVPLCDTPRG